MAKFSVKSMTNEVWSLCTTSLLAECRICLLFSISRSTLASATHVEFTIMGASPAVYLVLRYSVRFLRLISTLVSGGLSASQAPLEFSGIMNHKIEDTARLAICNDCGKFLMRTLCSKRVLLSGKRVGCCGDWVSRLSYVYVNKTNYSGRGLSL
jgi:hypothetical protein